MQFDRSQDLHSSTSYMYMTVSRAFGFYLDSLCAIFTAIIVITFMFVETGKLHQRKKKEKETHLRNAKISPQTHLLVKWASQ